MATFTEDLIWWYFIFFGFGWLCFYFGRYYGEVICRTCKYYYILLKRIPHNRRIEKKRIILIK